MNKGTRLYLYYFFEKVHSDINKKMREEQEHTKSFNFEEIIRYDASSFYIKARKPSHKKEDFRCVYDTKTYFSAFRHLANRTLHVKRAIEYIDKGRDPTYISVWLYCMLHMNNVVGRRKILSFPRLELRDIEHTAIGIL